MTPLLNVLHLQQLEKRIFSQNLNGTVPTGEEFHQMTLSLFVVI